LQKLWEDLKSGKAAMGVAGLGYRWKFSGMKMNPDFTVGYRPERINPGDQKHWLETNVKVVSGSTPERLKLVAHVYGSIIKAGVHPAPSIKVAEAAKVIENTQPLPWGTPRKCFGVAT